VIEIFVPCSEKRDRDRSSASPNVDHQSQYSETNLNYIKPRSWYGQGYAIFTKWHDTARCKKSRSSAKNETFIVSNKEKKINKY
jgi:hypothetical protein